MLASKKMAAQLLPQEFADQQIVPSAITSPLTQMQNFPMPRYRPTITLPRMLAPLGMANTNAPNPQPFTPSNFSEMHLQMAQKWNYYYPIPEAAGIYSLVYNPITNSCSGTYITNAGTVPDFIASCSKALIDKLIQLDATQGNNAPNLQTSMFKEWGSARRNLTGMYPISTAAGNFVNNATTTPGSAFWQVAKYLNSPINNRHLSTPDFYPRQSEWNTWGGASPGWTAINHARINEIERYGDEFYSPYISPSLGIKPERGTKRPAEWLGLLKLLNASGAVSFQVWNDYPNNIYNRIWTVATSAYAQALNSWAYNAFLVNGHLLLGQPISASNSVKDYLFLATSSIINTDAAVLARKANGKLQKRYLIATTLQPSSHFTTMVVEIRNNIRDTTYHFEPNVPANVEGTIQTTIEGIALTLNSRRQGSVYVLDAMNPNALIFYQTDAWHQWQHPMYWDSNFKIEAEMYSTGSNFVIATKNSQTNADIPASAANFTNFVSYISSPNGQQTSVNYEFEPRTTQNSFVYVKARSQSPANVSISLSGNNRSVAINSPSFQWLAVGASIFTTAQSQTLSATFAANVEIDQWYISNNANLPTH